MSETQNNNKKDELGALWERTLKNDPSKTYLGGYLTLSINALQKMLERAQNEDDNEYKLNIVAFVNEFKSNDTQPSYRIKKSNMKPQSSSGSSSSPQSFQKAAATATEETEVEDLL